MVGTLFVFWDGSFSGAMLNLRCFVFFFQIIPSRIMVQLENSPIIEVTTEPNFFGVLGLLEVW